MPEIKRKLTYRNVHIIIRSIVAILFLISGILLSDTSFFEENFLFGVRYLARILITIIAAFMGFFLIPDLFAQIPRWFESLVQKTVSDAVASFWDQQNKRMQDARREKDKKRVEEDKEKFEKSIENSILLDTSVLVDGRVLDIYKTNFLCNSLVVPQFVIEELQLIADNDNTQKRSRGRLGLDILKELRKVTKVVITQDGLDSENKDVDKALVSFAKRYKLRLMTLDFNLNKVASVSGVTTLNINDLANAIRPAVLPGEIFEIKIVQEGKEATQGVGYLHDGTMVVVKNAQDMVGKKVDIEVTKVIQSSAGKMIFAKSTAQ
jgi:uncharacterized protein YacL